MFGRALRWQILFLLVSGMILGIAGRAAAVAEESPPSKPQSVRSPDQTIEVSVCVDGPLAYRVVVDGQPVINSSRLGLKLRDGTTFGHNVELVNATNQSCDSTWENPFGPRLTVRDNHNQLCLLLREKSAEGRSFEVVFRAFNDGVAFRYELLSQPGSREFILDEEQSEFVFPADYTCYACEWKRAFTDQQEWEFARRRLSDIKPDSNIDLPLLVETPVAWVAIAEADLLDWAGMGLRGAAPELVSSSPPARSENTDPSVGPPIDSTTDPAGVALVAKLAPRCNGDGLVKSNTPHDSAWRVLMIGRGFSELNESELIRNLSTPNQLQDTSWIKPGMTGGDPWWSGRIAPTTDAIKKRIQLTADMGWPYHLVDRNWYGEPNQGAADITRAIDTLDMAEVRRFAEENNVRLWLWVRWQDLDRNDCYKQAFPLYKGWGIAGVTIDSMDRRDQEMVQWCERITRVAAENELLVSFHGAFKPIGLDRTFPNQQVDLSPILRLCRETFPSLNQ